MNLTDYADDYEGHSQATTRVPTSAGVSSTGASLVGSVATRHVDDRDAWIIVLELDDEKSKDMPYLQTAGEQETFVKLPAGFEQRRAVRLKNTIYGVKKARHRYLRERRNQLDDKKNALHLIEEDGINASLLKSQEQEEEMDEGWLRRWWGWWQENANMAEPGMPYLPNADAWDAYEMVAHRQENRQPVIWDELKHGPQWHRYAQPPRVPAVPGREYNVDFWRAVVDLQEVVEKGRRLAGDKTVLLMDSGAFAHVCPLNFAESGRCDPIGHDADGGTGGERKADAGPRHEDSAVQACGWQAHLHPLPSHGRQQANHQCGHAEEGWLHDQLRPGGCLCDDRTPRVPAHRAQRHLGRLRWRSTRRRRLS